MVELIRDSAWGAAGTVLTLVSIVVAVLIYRWQRQTRELAFGLISSRRLVSVDRQISSRVTVQLDGRPIEHPRLSVFGLKNSGHQVIEAEDFKAPLTIEFAQGKVLSAEIADEGPGQLGGALLVTETTVTLVPLLLNAGDYLVIQVLLSSPTEHHSYSARIRGVPKPVRLNLMEARPRLGRSAASSLFALSVSVLSVAYFTGATDALRGALSGIGTVAVFYGGYHVWHSVGAASRRRITEKR